MSEKSTFGKIITVIKWILLLPILGFVFVFIPNCASTAISHGTLFLLWLLWLTVGFVVAVALTILLLPINLITKHNVSQYVWIAWSKVLNILSDQYGNISKTFSFIVRILLWVAIFLCVAYFLARGNWWSQVIDFFDSIFASFGKHFGDFAI